MQNKTELLAHGHSRLSLSRFTDEECQPNESNDAYRQVRDRIVGRGLPFFFSERSCGDGTILRSVACDHLAEFEKKEQASESLGFKNAPSKKTKIREGDVFVEGRFSEHPVRVGDFSYFLKKMSEHNIFLETVVFLPRSRESRVDESIVFSSALFHDGFFVPKAPAYAEHLLREVFPKFAETRLEQILADGLSLALAAPQHIGIARAFLDLGADPNRPSMDGVSPLSEALLNTNVAGAKLVLDRGADAKKDMAAEDPLEILQDDYDPVEHKDLFDLVKRRAAQT